MSQANALTTNNHFFGQAQTYYPDYIKTFNVQTDYTFVCKNCDICHGGEDTNYRPYLRMDGVITDVMIPDYLKDDFRDIDRLTTGIPSTVFYQFTDEDFDSGNFKLSEYFNGNLEPDRGMICDSIYELTSGVFDLAIFMPRNKDGTPVFFVGMQNPHDITETRDTSGYALVSYLVPVRDRSLNTLHEDMTKAIKESYDDVKVDDISNVAGIVEVKNQIVDEYGISHIDGIGYQAGVTGVSASSKETVVDPVVTEIREAVVNRLGLKKDVPAPVSLNKDANNKTFTDADMSGVDFKEFEDIGNQYGDDDD